MPQKKPLILLIEDDKTLADMYALKIEKAGFEMFLAEDGMSGLKLAQEKKPDLILLDIILPKLDGFAILKELKGNPKTKDIPIIILTNLGQEKDIKKGLKMGASSYLVKANLTPARVVEEVEKQLKR